MGDNGEEASAIFFRLRRHIRLEAIHKILKVREGAKRVELDVVLYDTQQPGSHPWRTREHIFETLESGFKSANDGIGASCVIVHQVIVGADGGGFPRANSRRERLTSQLRMKLPWRR